MASKIALTGGLDSTWCLQYMKRAGNKVEAALFNMGNGPSAVLLEYLMGREIIRRLWKASTNGIFTYDLLGQRELGGYYRATTNTPAGRLLQQQRVVNGLAKLATEDTPSRDPVHCVVGWHKDDAFENNGEWGDWSLADYEKLKELFYLQCYFSDCGRRIQPLHTPAWNKSKAEMWNELPEDVRPLVTIHRSANFLFSQKRMELLIYTEPGFQSAKGDKYAEVGIGCAHAWIIKVDGNLISELRTSAISPSDRPLAITCILENSEQYPNRKDVMISEPLTVNQWFTFTRWSSEGESIILEFKEDNEAFYDALQQQKRESTEATTDA